MQILIYILKRILQSIPLLVIVSVISFFIIRLSPVDPLAELRLNPSVSQETLEKETKRLGLDKPIQNSSMSRTHACRGRLPSASRFCRSTLTTAISTA